MRASTSRTWWALPLLLAAVLAAVVRWQRADAAQLQAQRAQLIGEVTEGEQLRTENIRLRASLPPPHVVEQMRSDHEALPRMRREFEELKKNLRTRIQAQAAARATEARPK